MVSEPRSRLLAPCTLLALSPLLPCSHQRLLPPRSCPWIRSESQLLCQCQHRDTEPPPSPFPGLEGAVLFAWGQQERIQVFLEGHTGTQSLGEDRNRAEPAALISATFGVSLFSSCELAKAAGCRRRDNSETNQTSPLKEEPLVLTAGRGGSCLLWISVIHQKGRVWFVLGAG